MFDANTYAEAPKPERSWNTVAGKGVKKNAKGTVQLKNATPNRPPPHTQKHHPRRLSAVDPTLQR